ncbi:hypothetical protein [Streptomyces sp. NPDC085596]|uniref:hypothetical protein n=1 Tax=Streptomyces sp. NPDC085596 TaxID=3365731 RepID=UPI0037D88B83
MPVVVSNAVRHADTGQHRLADVLDAARLLRPIPPRAVDGGERWLKGPDGMAAAAARIAAAAGQSFSGRTKPFTDPRICAAIVDRLTFGLRPARPPSPARTR